MPEKKTTDIRTSESASDKYVRATPHIPDHELLRMVGRGSYGEVWLARNAVGTFRAVKLVYRDQFSEPHPYEREFNGMRQFEPFSRSSEGLVDILHVGRDDRAGYFYYVMELADDATNGQEIDPEKYVPRTLSKELLRRGRLPVEECLELGLTLNLALGHLHRGGLIHRDIKPANIIYVAGVPKLADIGLVTLIPEAHSLVGTIGFIAPEGPHSPPADLYSLGKVLYEAGMGKDRQDFPEPLTNLDQARDAAMLLELNAIILRACAANPNDRYASAEEMNADLALVKSGESVRRKRTLERRLVKLRRTTVGAATVIAIIGAGYFWQSRQTHKMERLAKENLKLAAAEQEAAREARHRLNEMDVAKGQQLLEQDDSYKALLWFANSFGQVAQDPVLAEAHRLRFGSLLKSAPKVTQLFTHAKGIMDFKFSPDGRRLVSASVDHTARVWDLKTGRAITPRLEHEGIVMSCDFSPDGKWVVTASGDARVWDAASGKLITTFKKHRNWVKSASFDSEGKRVLTVGADQTVRVWDPLTGRELIAALEHSDDVQIGKFSPDGETIATGSGRMAYLWEANSGRQLTALRHDLRVWYVEFSPDGRRLATGQGGDPNVSDSRPYKAAALLWNTKTGERLCGPMWHDGSIKKVVFSPDGRYCATAGWEDSTVRIWDGITGEQLGTPIKAGHEIWDVQFSPDGRRIVTSAANGSARVWDIFTGKPLTPVLRHTGWVVRSAFSPDGRFVATASDDHTIKVWDLVTSTDDDLVIQHPGYLNGLPYSCFSPDGKKVLTVCYDGMARLWDAQTGKLLVSMRHGKHAGLGFFSPDGKTIITAAGEERESGEDNADYFTEARIWDAATGKEIAPPVKDDRAVLCVSFSPDGKRFATGGSKARVWDTFSGEPVSPWLKHKGLIVGTDFSPDGRILLTASYDSTAQMWNAENGERIGRAMEHPAQVYVAKFSPDGKKILTICSEQMGRVWDARNGEPISPWLKHNGALYLGAWSADSTRVMTGGLADCAKVWDAASGNLVLPWLMHGTALEHLAFSRDGRLIMTAGWDDSVRVWSAVTGELLVHRNTRHDDMKSAQLSPDGLRMLTGGSDGQARVWNMQKCDLEAKEMVMLAEILSGEELDKRGEPVSLPAEQVMERWQVLKTRHAELFTTSRDHVRDWFMRRLKESLALQHFSSAKFYLDRLLSETPQDETLKRYEREIQECHVQPRDDSLSPKLIDLTAFYNWVLHPPVESPVERLDVSELPVGVQTLGGTEFDVRGIIRVNQRDQMVSGRLWPSSVSGIRVNQRCQRLHFLHGAIRSSTGALAQDLDGVTLGAYIIHYADGQQREFPIVYGSDVRDCMLKTNALPATNALVAWTGGSPAARKFNLCQQLYQRTWENPMPAVEIKSVDFVSRPALCQPFLVAITVE
jgi:WD40 repeat protein